ncbi:molybdate ABC transporter substrate-binding protein [Desulfocucumis palustris]|uniref:molybdate ABC transporter substrate-binding protein n=1 Tax=Desulfocucumis palustris TaxID=1898651 RepID=UPI001E45A419|nr:molybdate ABC transporter substrate-binding protein [Desulfocucumis palustris]
MFNQPIKNIKLFLVLSLTLLLLVGCANTTPAEQKAPENQQDSATAEKAPMFAYVGAGLKEPFSEIAALYEQKTGVKLETSFNNSGALLNQMETAKKGDIFMPGSMPYIQKAKEAGYLGEMAGPIAYHTPAIITPKGNPAHITKIEDLAKPGVKIIMPDKEATAMGKTAFKIFDKLGITAQVEKNILTYAETPMKVAEMLMLGQGNAGITEISMYKNRDKLDVIEIDPGVNMPEEIPCALLTFSTQQEQAKDFLEFMKQEGPAIFAKHGFKTGS